MSALELVAGSVLVIGHNVYRVLPNEVPILVLAGLVSARVRDGSLASIGLRRPPSWKPIAAIALAAAAVRLLLGAFVVDPLTARFWPPAEAPAGADAITGNLVYALAVLAIVWIFAAFGEEVAYRGYLLTRAADLGGRSAGATLAAVVVVSVLFGYGHFYKGPSGVIDSGMAGLVLGTAYLVSGRNLWTSIIAHGVIDTVGIIALYFGWDA